MTKLLKVNCGVCFLEYAPEADEDYNPYGMMLLIRFIFLTIGMTVGILMTGMNFDKKSRVISPAFPLLLGLKCLAITL